MKNKVASNVTTLDVVLRHLGSDNPPDLRADAQPAKMPQREDQKEFKVTPVEQVALDIPVKKSFGTVKSQPAYPTLSKILGYQL